MVGIAACGKSVDRAFQIGNTGNELRVLHGGAGKADNGDTAAAADLPVLRAAPAAAQMSRKERKREEY